jgi:hypothetical protein
MTPMHTLTLTAAGLMTAWAVPCFGQADPLATAVRYHEAARAAEVCNVKKLTPAEHDKLAVLVGRETQNRLTIGQELTAIRESRINMDLKVQSSGCKDPLVVDALRFFSQFRDRLR